MTQRPAPRANVRLAVTLVFDGSDLQVPAVSVNLSETGVLVRTARRTSRGTLAELEFKEFRARGEVIWTGQTSEEGVLLGMKFVSISRSHRKFVRELVQAAGGF